MFKTLLKGLLIGAADPIPGVSGGTVAFMTGIYDELLDRITRFTSHPDGFRKNIAFLLPVCVGLLVGIFTFAHLADWLISNQPELTLFTFIGLVLGSISPILIRERPSLQGWPIWIALAIAFFIAVLFSWLPKPELNSPITDPGVFQMLWIFLAGALASATMVVPGISGSFLQLLIGSYSTYITAIKDVNLAVLIPFMSGGIIGIAAMAKLISALFRKHYHGTLLAIAGLVLGSVVVLWPGFGAKPVMVLGLWFCLSGLASGWYLSTFKTRKTNRLNGKVWLAVVLSGFMTCLLVIWKTNNNVPVHAYFNNLDTPELIAHQGGNLESPDESLVAFDHAIDVGVQSLELDVHLSNDGHLIVMHDSDVSRTTNGSGVIPNLSLAEIKQLDSGYWWPMHQPKSFKTRIELPSTEFPYRNEGVTVPTLAEIFDRYPEHRIVIEIKQPGNEIISALGNMIDKYSRWETTLVASFYTETMVQFRKSYPQALTSGTKPEILLFYILHRLNLAQLFHSPFQVFQVPMKSGGLDVITAEFIEDAHNLGIRVQAWTINDVETVKKLVGWKIDGIITDRPELINNSLK